jgi:glutathione S-transferase
MNEIIFHHYPESPYSEKVRLVFGLKGLAWRSVIIPNIMPKPDLTPLTGGYRRTPVMQIGAEVFCDTQVIARELERRHPTPTLYPGGSAGIAHALTFWSDRELFAAAVGLIFGAIGDAVPQEFLADRSQMMGREFDPSELKAAIPIARDQLRAHVDLLEQQLGDGRSFLLGEAAGLLDFTAYHPVWFVRNFPPVAAGLEPFGAVTQWCDRVAAIGHGSERPMESRDALAVARDCEPQLDSQLDPGDPNGRKPGDRVRVFPDDYGRDPVEGTLVASDAHRIAIRRTDEAVGDVVVHFPRAGFVVVPG